MVALLPENLDWIRPIHLFHGLPDEVLADFLADMEPVPFAPGDLLLQSGEACRGLCFVRRGQVELLRLPEIPRWHIPHEAEQALAQATTVAVVESRDYFGEDCVLSTDDYPAYVYTARALTEGEVYCWPLEAVHEAMAAHRRIGEALRLVRESRQRIQRRRPRWLPDDERVYLFIGRPIVALYPRLMPVLPLFFVAMVLFFWSAWRYSTLLLVAGGLVSLVALVLGLWQFVDWRNDYCLVTNTRVVWVDKVVFLYESRNEAPLFSVLAVSLSTTWWGRRFRYGNVLVRTYGGMIVIDEVAYPEAVEAIIEEYWQRTRDYQGVRSRDERLRAVRETLGLAENQNVPSAGAAASPSPQREPWLRRQLRRVFSQRLEEDGVIIYRKHWYLLLRRSWLWWVLLGGWVVASLWALATGVVPFSGVVLGLVVVVSLVLLGFVIYNFWDWINDQYRITPDHIEDVYKKPLGSEDKQTAPLESIENMTYERHGFLGWLLNFGNVAIRVGTVTMVWEGVARPDMVQQEIFRRMTARRQQRREAEERQERERLLAWLNAYHEVTRQEDEPPEDDMPPQSGV